MYLACYYNFYDILRGIQTYQTGYINWTIYAVTAHLYKMNKMMIQTKLNTQ